jgi:hypothetical protein
MQEDLGHSRLAKFYESIILAISKSVSKSVSGWMLLEQSLGRTGGLGNGRSFHRATGRWRSLSGTVGSTYCLLVTGRLLFFS